MSLVVSCVLLMVVSIILGYCIYESVQVETKPRRKRNYRPTYYRKIDSDEPLESWESVERKLIAEGKISASSVRERGGPRVTAAW